MEVEIIINPTNSVIFISDVVFMGEVPENISNCVVSASNRAISVWTMPEMDGSTKVVLYKKGCLLNFDFMYEISSPSNEIVLSDANGGIYFQENVGNNSAIIKIKVNNTVEPDEIKIEIG
jgi:hypothetical protein